MIVIKDMILGAALMAGLSAFAVYLVVPMIAQPVQSPAAINGCIVITSQTSMTALQNTALTCDVLGRLRVTTTP